MRYECVGDWGDKLQSSFLKECVMLDERAASFVRTHGVTTPADIKVAASDGIALLQNDGCLEGYDAEAIWQYSQCLKKFKYGCTASPEEMRRGWVERNAACENRQLPLWVASAVAELLKPLDEAYARQAGTGRFGNGACYEGFTNLSKWNEIPRGWAYDIRDPDDITKWRQSSYDAARLSAVPKDMFKLRLITVEPAEQTFLQQYVRDRLLKACQVLPWSCSIPAQLYGEGEKIQRERCYRGSVTGETATIDLSDASDSIAYWDIMTVFPPLVRSELERARSPYVEVNGTKHRCHMFAGMGNATTFVVESLFFWGVFTAISRRLRDFTPVSVYGDDIVLGIKAATHPLFLHYVNMCGLRVNVAKCGLSCGPGFREACGLVAYRGRRLNLLRIQGYRIEKPCEKAVLCSLINEGLAGLYHDGIQVLLDSIRRELLHDRHIPVVPVSLARQGIYLVDPTPNSSGTCHSRWNTELQRREWKVAVLGQESKIFWSENATPGEALGILNGQLQTLWADSPIGTKAGRLALKLPVKDSFKVSQQWVPADYAAAVGQSPLRWDDDADCGFDR